LRPNQPPPQNTHPPKKKKKTQTKNNPTNASYRRKARLPVIAVKGRKDLSRQETVARAGGMDSGQTCRDYPDLEKEQKGD